jgi:hypothetical protein
MHTKYLTIPGFEQLSQQRIFNMAAEHVLNNGKPAMVCGVCTYAGIGCAASVFLANPKNAPVASWLRLTEWGDAPNHEEELIHAIQVAHDRNAYGNDYDAYGNRKANGNFIADFMKSMLEVATEYKLDPSILYTKLTHNPA